MLWRIEGKPLVAVNEREGIKMFGGIWIDILMK